MCRHPSSPPLHVPMLMVRVTWRAGRVRRRTLDRSVHLANATRGRTWLCSHGNRMTAGGDTDSTQEWPSLLHTSLPNIAWERVRQTFDCGILANSIAMRRAARFHWWRLNHFDSVGSRSESGSSSHSRCSNEIERCGDDQQTTAVGEQHSTLAPSLARIEVLLISYSSATDLHSDCKWILQTDSQADSQRREQVFASADFQTDWWRCGR